MKNIFFLIIDAFCYDNLERKIGSEHTTPFLREMACNNLFAINMYAQAPYTEASYISLLSGENTLDSGGYLFGNNTTKTTNFARFKKLGYKTISQYAPYVYSKAYLRDVDIYYYTRLISIKILFDYRLYYYRDKYLCNTLTELETRACLNLLEEEFDAWITQAEAIVARKDNCKLILDWVDINNIASVLEELKTEFQKFKMDRDTYLFSIFKDFSSHKLIDLDNQYNVRRRLRNCDLLASEYSDEFNLIQKNYTKIIRRDYPDLCYLKNTLFNYKDGFKKFKGLVHNYMRYYGNSFISDYLVTTNENAKNEVCMKRQFDYVLNLVDDVNKEGNPAYVYLHVQDFHLPATIHSVDYDALQYQRKEIDEAIQLANKIDDKYQGNLLADLSARFCDNKVRELYYTLKEKYQDNFTLVVTADHGFPSYFNPPRSIIYNQTFSEAFHVPFILIGGKNELISELTSTMDFFELITKGNIEKKREYILSEYGGPGCPSIVDKDIWYTYIDKQYRVSVEAKIDEQVQYKNITGIFDRVNDIHEKNNLIRKMETSPEIKKIIDIIDKRNCELKVKFSGERFLNYMVSSHSTQKE